jgi:hypothetical protein
MLAREITDLASCWFVRIAWSSLSRHVRIEVAVGGGAVAVGAYWEVVDVIDCAFANWGLISDKIELTEWTTLSRQARDADIKVDTLTSRIGARDNRASDRIVLWEGGDVLHTLRIVGCDGSAVGEDSRK